jgi:hypothetical protein
MTKQPVQIPLICKRCPSDGGDLRRQSRFTSYFVESNAPHLANSIVEVLRFEINVGQKFSCLRFQQRVSLVDMILGQVRAPPKQQLSHPKLP